jgi:DNA-binding response OmpR family regulator
MSELLLIEATEDLQSLAREAERAGFTITPTTLEDAAAKLREREAFDAVVVNLASRLDARVAGQLLGSESLPETTARIVVIEREAVSALPADLEVDDFVTAPAAPDEFVARLRRAIRRRSGDADANVIHCGPLAIDQANYQVHVGSRPVVLTYKEYELLRFLALNQDRVCTRETLLSQVWGYDFYGGARTVDVHIRRLRSKIEDPGHALIETVRNVGYRLRPAPPPTL